VLAAQYLGNGIRYKNQAESTIEVTGLGNKDFDSDLIIWNGSFSKNAFDIKDAYASLSEDRKTIERYFSEKGIKPSEIVFQSVDIQPEYEYTYDERGRSHSEFKGYKLTQGIKIEATSSASDDRLSLVENISRDVTELINEGIELYSGSPQYYYTKLEDLKIEMMAAATANGKERAQQIADNSGGSLGDLKEARMGVFQIVGRNANEEYSWGGTLNTSSRQKTAQITVKLKFLID
jgi:hypothetical protein